MFSNIFGDYVIGEWLEQRFLLFLISKMPTDTNLFYLTDRIESIDDNWLYLFRIFIINNR